MYANKTKQKRAIPHFRTIVTWLTNFAINLNRLDVHKSVVIELSLLDKDD
jgi:hypothetical protein